ncbi:uncharacterized protein LOC144093728 [Amblyomma americanum]
MSSVGAVSAAQSGRGNRFFEATADDYQVILPNLPSGHIVPNTVFMHGDPRARPYRVEDYRDTLANLGALPDVVALGAYQMNHVWAVTMTTADAAQKLLLAVDVKVKDRPCLLIDPNNREVRVKLHWLLHGVTDEDVRVALSPYGKVLQVTREKWRALGVTEKGSTTRTVGLKLHADVKIDDIPHQLKIAGELTLVVVPGRAPLCLRCKSTGHIRRDCKVPRCSRCRRFGHVDADCAKTYASVAGPVQANDISDHLMDEEDSEETARTSRNLVTQGASSNFQGEQLIDGGDKPADKRRHDDAEGGNEKDEASTTGHPSPGGGEKPPTEPAPVTVMDSDSISAAAKRPHDAGENGKELSVVAADEPPAKTTVGRRPSFRPLPNTSAARKTAETPPMPP